MRRAVMLPCSLALALFSGCVDSSALRQAGPFQTLSAVGPSPSGSPNSLATLNNYEFISVQGTGQIFTYSLAGGTQTWVSTYATPCHDPSGMAIGQIEGSSVMAVVCYDTGSLLTLTIADDGSLHALGSVGGLPVPYPGIVLDGTDLFVPLFGLSGAGSGSIARVNLASPAAPQLTGLAVLAQPVPGGYANVGYITAAKGYLYIASGSESAPTSTSSTIQVVNEAMMTLVGTPLAVAHSPQQIAVQGSVAYVTNYDATQIESIDISNPANLKVLQIFPLTATGAVCHAEPLVVRDRFLFAGCFEEGVIDRFDISDPANMQLTQSNSGFGNPQRMIFSGDSLLVTSYASGGMVYLVDTGIVWG